MSGCEKYAEMMNRYLDGDLPAAQISDLLDHLETCASCRNRFDALKIMAFEMRHMQVEPPKALHGQIMQAVSRSGQRRPRAYLKTFAAVAACAAALALAINGSFFQMADNYLFRSDRKTAPAEQEQPADLKADGAAPGASAAPADMPESAPEAPQVSQEPAPEPYQADDEQEAKDEAAPAEASAGPQEEEGADPDASRKESAGEGAAPEENNAAPPAGADAPTFAPGLRAAAPAAGGQNQAPLPHMDQGTREAEVKNEPEIDPDQPLRIPALDTDEVFAFYCVALGEGSIPNAFDQNEIVRFPDKNCMYIYVKTTQFTKKGCENLLSQSGFTIREGANLPDTDESMPYGLIVIYNYQAGQ